MQLLSEGIKIHLEAPVSLAQEGRVHLSSGTHQPFLPVQNGLRYCSDAFLPQEPWREPSEADLDLLLVSPGLDASRCITVFRLPDNAFAGLEKIGLRSISTAENLQSLRKHTDYQNAIESLLNYIKLFYRSTEGLVVNPVVANPPGLQTVTYDKTDDCYIGLHLDSWDRSPLTERDKARNRICINMGANDRYLIFMNLTLIDMFRKLYENTDPKHFQQTGRLGETFMEKYPSYPVVKLRIAPHEAYIAPTENMLHDGCTLGQSTIDLILHVRGFFVSSRPVKNPSNVAETSDPSN